MSIENLLEKASKNLENYKSDKENLELANVVVEDIKSLFLNLYLENSYVQDSNWKYKIPFFGPIIKAIDVEKNIRKGIPYLKALSSVDSEPKLELKMDDEIAKKARPYLILGRQISNAFEKVPGQSFFFIPAKEGLGNLEKLKKIGADLYFYLGDAAMNQPIKELRKILS